MIRRPPRATLFPYPTLSQSRMSNQTGRVKRTTNNQPRRSPTQAASASRHRHSGGALAERTIKGRTYSEYASVRSHSRSEEHTSELQSRQYLVCRLLLEQKKH